MDLSSNASWVSWFGSCLVWQHTTVQRSPHLQQWSVQRSWVRAHAHTRFINYQLFHTTDHSIGAHTNTGISASLHISKAEILSSSQWQQYDCLDRACDGNTGLGKVWRETARTCSHWVGWATDRVVIECRTEGHFREWPTCFCALPVCVYACNFEEVCVYVCVNTVTLMCPEVDSQRIYSLGKYITYVWLQRDEKGLHQNKLIIDSDKLCFPEYNWYWK